MKNRKQIHDNWETPKDFLDKIRDEFGDFFDPCPINADFDGLSIDWKEVNFVNPPYNRKLKEAFIFKAYCESKKNKTCILLLPVSTSTEIFHNFIDRKAEVRFIRRRLKFKGINTKGELVENKCGQHDSMLVIYRPTKDLIFSEEVKQEAMQSKARHSSRA
jgi:hypothetical protein